MWLQSRMFKVQNGVTLREVQWEATKGPQEILLISYETTGTADILAKNGTFCMKIGATPRQAVKALPRHQ